MQNFSVTKSSRYFTFLFFSIFVLRKMCRCSGAQELWDHSFFCNLNICIHFGLFRLKLFCFCRMVHDLFMLLFSCKFLFLVAMVHFIKIYITFVSLLIFNFQPKKLQIIKNLWLLVLLWFVKIEIRTDVDALRF